MGDTPCYRVMNARARYIAWRGFLPWGALAGGGAAYVVVRSAWRDHATGSGVPLSALIVLAVLCFVMWATIVGWIVGVILWELRGARRPPSGPVSRPRS